MRCGFSVGASPCLANRSPHACFSRRIATWTDTTHLPQHPCLIDAGAGRLFDRRSLPQDSMDACFLSLQWCISSKSLLHGMCLHSRIVSHSLEHHRPLFDLLLRMYVVCGAFLHAKVLITGSNHQSTSSWNILIKAFLKHGCQIQALCVFAHICKAKLLPDLSMYIAVVMACTVLRDLDGGRLLYSCFLEDNLDMDNALCTSLIYLYGKCGDLESACSIFHDIAVRDVAVWNALICVHSEHAKGREALSLLLQMQHEGTHPNRVTFVSILSAFGTNHFLAEGQRIHFLATDFQCDSDTVVGTALLNMYSKCGSTVDATRVFNNLSFQDLVSWNTIIGTYVTHGFRKQALQLFEQMQQVGILTDKVTFINILDVSVEHTDKRELARTHTCILSKGLHSDIIVGTTLMNMCGKCGTLEGAQEVFNGIADKDLIAWNAMLALWAENDEYKNTHQLFARMLLEGVLPCRVSFSSTLSAYVGRDMLAEGKKLHACIVGSKLLSDLVLGNALVNMYSKCEYLDGTIKVFWGLPERDVVSWNTLMAGCAQLEHQDDALQLFQQMLLEGFIPDKFTLVSILDACINQAALFNGKVMHCYFQKNSFSSDTMVGTSLVTMYGKCGSLSDAERAFNNMPKQNSMSWNALIGTFAQHGEAKRAILYFQRMKHNLNPDKVTFTIILNACSHAGLIDEALDIFSSITEKYKLTYSVDHFSCMIDLLGRVGRLSEAEELLQCASCERNAVLYKTLLGACMQQNDVERGEHAAISAFKFDSKDPTPLVMLSNIYSAAAQ